jgi:hypothetical protein
MQPSQDLLTLICPRCNWKAVFRCAPGISPQCRAWPLCDPCGAEKHVRIKMKRWNPELDGKRPGRGLTVSKALRKKYRH